MSTFLPLSFFIFSEKSHNKLSRMNPKSIINYSVIVNKPLQRRQRTLYRHHYHDHQHNLSKLLRSFL